tara:strand:- start:632 stop:829 length:198 start_codon:yes stop_codon:yes gene_type:complete
MYYSCECGAVLINHYSYQLDKHRRSKKHLNKLIERHKEWYKPKEPKKEEVEVEVEPENEYEMTFD